MAVRTFLPSTDGGLLQWATAFSTQITAAAASFGLTTSQASSFASALSSYSSALNAATNDSTRTKGTVAGKNQARQVLRDQARMLAALVQAFPAITDHQLSDLGLTVRSHSTTPVNPPALAPLVTPLSVIGRVAKFKLYDATAPSSKRKPPNADGVTIMSATGATPPPAGDPGWKLEGQTGKMTFSVQFGNDVAAGTPCWVVAFWYCKRGDYSPACDPVQVYLQVPGTSEEQRQPILKVSGPEPARSSLRKGAKYSRANDQQMTKSQCPKW